MIDIPGKGAGLIATHPIARGHTIIRESPLVDIELPTNQYRRDWFNKPENHANAKVARQAYLALNATARSRFNTLYSLTALATPRLRAPKLRLNDRKPSAGMVARPNQQLRSRRQRKMARPNLRRHLARKPFLPAQRHLQLQRRRQARPATHATRHRRWRRNRYRLRSRWHVSCPRRQTGGSGSGLRLHVRVRGMPYPARSERQRTGVGGQAGGLADRVRRPE